MPNRHQNEYIDDLLDLLTSRVYRKRCQSRVPGPDGFRTIEDLIDDTGIGRNNETEVQIVRNEIILDCGHPARGNLGGRCHYCDALVCRGCVAICSSCGLATCNLHTVTANFDGQNKPYCRECAEEIRRSLKLRLLGETILSFFVSSNRGKS